MPIPSWIVEIKSDSGLTYKDFLGVFSLYQIQTYVPQTTNSLIARPLSGITNMITSSAYF